MKVLRGAQAEGAGGGGGVVRTKVIGSVGVPTSDKTARAKVAQADDHGSAGLKVVGKGQVGGGVGQGGGMS